METEMRGPENEGAFGTWESWVSLKGMSFYIQEFILRWSMFSFRGSTKLGDSIILWGVSGRISCVFFLAIIFFRRGFGARELVWPTSHLCFITRFSKAPRKETVTKNREQGHGPNMAESTSNNTSFLLKLLKSGKIIATKPPRVTNKKVFFFCMGISPKMPWIQL